MGCLKTVAVLALVETIVTVVIVLVDFNADRWYQTDKLGWNLIYFGGFLTGCAFIYFGKRFGL